MNKARTIELNPRKIQKNPILPNQAKTVRKNPLKFADDSILPLWMSQAKTIWKNSLNLQMTLFCHRGMNKARTIELNPRKLQNDPILPNPAKTVRKNLLTEFADDSILPLWMNQAKLFSGILEKCKRTLFWNPAETIGKNPFQNCR